MSITNLWTIKRAGFELILSYDENNVLDWGYFDADWKGTDIHEGGVTIANPLYNGDGTYKYYTPVNASLKEVVSGYEGAEGVRCPSSTAYASMKHELLCDLRRFEFKCTLSVYRCGVLLDDLDQWVNYSHEYENYSIIQAVQDCYTESIEGEIDGMIVIAKEKILEMGRN